MVTLKYFWTEIHYRNPDTKTYSYRSEQKDMDEPDGATTNYALLVAEDPVPETTNVAGWKYIPKYKIFQNLQNPTLYGNYAYVVGLYPDENFMNY